VSGGSLSYDDFTVGWTFDVLVEYNLSDGIGDDTAAGRIFHALNKTTNVGLYSGVLKGAVTLRIESAIFQHQVMSIA
jgi:hypothetical protein